MPSHDNGKETACGTQATARGTIQVPTIARTATASASRTQADRAPAEQFLKELRPHLLARRETAHRPAMKVPDAFDGTYGKPRPWWELVKGYLEIHEPAMPTESIQT